MANQAVWFDIPAKDLERAIRFYSAVLGVSVERQQHGDATIGVLPHAGHDVSGCIFTGAEAKPSDGGPLLYLSCQGRLDAAVAAVEKNEGKVVKPKHAIGPYGFRAVVLDSEGNRIALHSSS